MISSSLRRDLKLRPSVKSNFLKEAEKRSEVVRVLAFLYKSCI